MYCNSQVNFLKLVRSLSNMSNPNLQKWRDFFPLKLCMNCRAYYHLVICHIAIENGSLTVDWPIPNGDFSWQTVSLPEGIHKQKSTMVDPPDPQHPNLLLVFLLEIVVFLAIPGGAEPKQNKMMGGKPVRKCWLKKLDLKPVLQKENHRNQIWNLMKCTKHRNLWDFRRKS